MLALLLFMVLEWIYRDSTAKQRKNQARKVSDLVVLLLQLDSNQQPFD